MPSSELYSFKVSDIDGKSVSLSRFARKVLLIVNTASQCGLTPQYEGLEKLYKIYRDRGFEVLAFPCNDFGDQEPGTNHEIKEFCSQNFKTTFPLFDKIAVLGTDKAPLYDWLTSPVANPQFVGDITWNFAKFLIDRQGRVSARFSPDVPPLDEKVVGTLERLLSTSE